MRTFRNLVFISLAVLVFNALNWIAVTPRWIVFPQSFLNTLLAAFIIGTVMWLTTLVAAVPVAAVAIVLAKLQKSLMVISLVGLFLAFAGTIGLTGVSFLLPNWVAVHANFWQAALIGASVLAICYEKGKKTEKRNDFNFWARAWIAYRFWTVQQAQKAEAKQNSEPEGEVVDAESVVIY